MGNLLGAPETTKDTHRGVMLLSEDRNENIPFAVSSMQGWRVSMEDAHIAEPRVYALDVSNKKNGTTTTADNDIGTTTTTSQKIELPGHAIFAVFDGHGGTFAALYAGRNLCRVLSVQPAFVRYARFHHERSSKTFASPSEKTQYLQEGLKHLEDALCDAFLQLDKEIALTLKGDQVPNADAPYHPQDATGDHPMTITHPSDTSDTSNNTVGQEQPSSASLADERDSGTTSCVVILTPDWIVCANAGDSRAVYSKAGHKAIPLSYDHKPDDDEEERRIRKAGGYVAGGRVEGDLAVSRGLGDFRFKDVQMILQDFPDNEFHPGDQKVSPIPDIIVQNRNHEQDEFLIVACDGIWDVQTNYEAVQSIAELFQEGETDIGLICEEMCDICLELGSKDNMTTLVVKFPSQAVGQGGGVKARRERRETAKTESENTSRAG